MHTNVILTNKRCTCTI